MTQIVTKRARGSAFRDALAGLVLFAVAMGAMSFASPSHSAPGSVSAPDAVATRAVQVTAGPGPEAENAMLSAAMGRPALAPPLPRTAVISVLGLTFAIIFAFNGTMVRQLAREVSAQRRRRRRDIRG